MSSATPSRTTTSSQGRSSGGCWWWTVSAWRWSPPAPRCTSSRPRGLQVSPGDVGRHAGSHWLIFPVVETIEKRREPMPAMEAIYLIGSSDASVKCLLQDFSSQNRTTYKFAHVYFTEGERLKRQNVCFHSWNIYIFSLPWWQIQGNLQLSGCQEDQDTEGDQHRLHTPRVSGVLSGQQGQFPALLQPSEGLREERRHGEDGRADRHPVLHPGGVPLHQIQSVSEAIYIERKLVFLCKMIIPAPH